MAERDGEETPTGWNLYRFAYGDSMVWIGKAPSLKAAKLEAERLHAHAIQKGFDGRTLLLAAKKPAHKEPVEGWELRKAGQTTSYRGTRARAVAKARKVGASLERVGRAKEADPYNDISRGDWVTFEQVELGDEP